MALILQGILHQPIYIFVGRVFYTGRILCTPCAGTDDYVTPMVHRMHLRHLEINKRPIFGQDFCLSSVLQQQAHSWLRNYCYGTDDGQKDQQEWMVICFQVPYVRTEGVDQPNKFYSARLQLTDSGVYEIKQLDEISLTDFNA